ncbi:MAG TPA: cytochrome ubiquinol oxidase subunit I [Pantoea sp.]|nr:cytochrome ubiquinol oxidase subunit I [Pantoea sp.]
MLNTLIVGASGYAGVELATFIHRHPHMNITALAVSAQSPDAGKPLSDLHPQLKGVVDLPLQPLSSAAEWADKVDVVFLATAHEVSHDLAPEFLKAGCVVFDLSGAFRVNDGEFYQRYYGFTHQHGDWLDKAVYGLAEWNHAQVKEAQLVAVPGCYPTAAQLALKPLIAGDLLFEMQRMFDWPFFDPQRGGDPLLWQHLFWIFGHPEVYIIFLPAIALLAMIIPTFAGRPIVGYSWIVLAAVGTGFLSFGLWVHHMYTVGIPHVALSFFSAASALVAVPTAIQIFAWLATLSHGRPRFSIPMLHIMGFFFVFVIGGLTGVMLAMVPFDWQAHDTHFVVAHLHYVLVGGFVFPMLAAGYYWLPHITGRQPVQHLSQAAFWMIFLGFNVTFFMMHLTGLRGMPRRVFEYPPESGWEMLNFFSSLGSFVMTMGFALVALDFLLLFRFGRNYHRNPWRAGTLEWAMPTPPPSYNFASLPVIDRRADLLDPDVLGPQLAAGKGLLGFPRGGHMELLAVDMVSGQPEHVVRLPRQTYLPLWTAVGTGCFFLSLLFKFYWVTPLALASVIAMFLFWTRDTAEKEDVGLLPIGNGQELPPHIEADRPPSWWAMVFTLVADATAYISLLFGSLFLWVSAPNWPPQDIGQIGLAGPAMAVVSLALAAWGGRQAPAGGGRGAIGWLILAGAGHLIATGIFLWLALTALPPPSSHAAVASIFVVFVYAALHSALGVVFSGYGIWRVRSGFVSRRRNLDLRIGTLWHSFAAMVGLAAAAFPFVLASLTAGVAP